MTAQILDGNALGQKLRAGFKQQADELAAQGVRPGLAVILVGKKIRRRRFVRNKVNACAQAGFTPRSTFSSGRRAAVGFDKIAELNADDKIHGILVQLLPSISIRRRRARQLRPRRISMDSGRERLRLDAGQPCFIPVRRMVR